MAEEIRHALKDIRKAKNKKELEFAEVRLERVEKDLKKLLDRVTDDWKCLELNHGGHSKNSIYSLASKAFARWKYNEFTPKQAMRLVYELVEEAKNRNASAEEIGQIRSNYRAIAYTWHTRLYAEGVLERKLGCGKDHVYRFREEGAEFLRKRTKQF